MSQGILVSIVGRVCSVRDAIYLQRKKTSAKSNRLDDSGDNITGVLRTGDLSFLSAGRTGSRILWDDRTVDHFVCFCRIDFGDLVQNRKRHVLFFLLGRHYLQRTGVGRNQSAAIRPQHVFFCAIGDETDDRIDRDRKAIKEYENGNKL